MFFNKDFNKKETRQKYPAIYFKFQRHGDCRNYLGDSYWSTNPNGDGSPSSLIEIEYPKGFDISQMSDGYHSFKELYESRCVLTAAFFNLLSKSGIETCKSWRHYDGELCFGGGWFVVFAKLPTGQISFHYPEKDWDLFKIQEFRRGWEWDGHTTSDVHKRIADYSS